MTADPPVLPGRHLKGIAECAAETARLRKAPAEGDRSNAVAPEAGIGKVAPAHRKALLPNIVGNRMAGIFPKNFLKMAARKSRGIGYSFNRQPGIAQMLGDIKPGAL